MNKKSTLTYLGISTIIFLIYLILKSSGVEPFASHGWIAVTAPLWVVMICINVALFISTFKFGRKNGRK